MSEYICEEEGCDKPGDWYYWPDDGEDMISECKCPEHKSPESFVRGEENYE